MKKTKSEASKIAENDDFSYLTIVNQDIGKIDSKPKEDVT